MYKCFLFNKIKFKLIWCLVPVAKQLVSESIRNHDNNILGQSSLIAISMYQRAGGFRHIADSVLENWHDLACYN